MVSRASSEMVGRKCMMVSWQSSVGSCKRSVAGFFFCGTGQAHDGGRHPGGRFFEGRFFVAAAEGEQFFVRFGGNCFDCEFCPCFGPGGGQLASLLRIATVGGCLSGGLESAA